MFKDCIKCSQEEAKSKKECFSKIRLRDGLITKYKNLYKKNMAAPIDSAFSQISVLQQPLAGI